MKHKTIEVIKALGLVFGDIGTSPIYTLTVIFLLLKPTLPNIIGVVSLVIWTLIILVTVQYAWLAMSLEQDGQGGTIVLKEILVGLLKKKRNPLLLTLVTFAGLSLLIGDGVITPAISILSAVEGFRLIPRFAMVSQDYLIILAGILAIGLFYFQKHGTSAISKAFGPFLILWFIALFVSGYISILQYPKILVAINPWYGLHFLLANKLAGIILLSEVILCATGGEALYADMGHLGAGPIRHAWVLVFIALVTNYLGQGAFLATHPDTKNLLFGMFYHQNQALYTPFLLLSIAATIIASQAMISGMFSIVYQSITTRVMPMLKVDYTSEHIRSQIYIGVVNWFLLFFVLLVILIFRESSALAAAYGIAVTGTMTLTSMMIVVIFYLKKDYLKMGVSLLLVGVDCTFLFANMFKIPHGGYWSLIIASLPFSLFLIYTEGQKHLYRNLRPMKIATFLERFIPSYKNVHLPGTALFFLRSPEMIPPYIAKSMLNNGIIYDTNIFVCINIKDDPSGLESKYYDYKTDGLYVLDVQIGYMEIIDVDQILKKHHIHEKVIFYGVDDIMTENFIWKIFAFIRKITPSFVQFYKLPSDRIQGVITRISM